MNDPAETVAWWRERIDKPRFVYFIQADYGGPVKIGEAFDPFKRLAGSVQTRQPDEINAMPEYDIAGLASLLIRPKPLVPA